MQFALSRLFPAASKLRLQNEGLATPTIRCFSSSSSSKNAKLSSSKKAETAKEQRTVAVKSFVEKYMQMHPGVFPKPSIVQNVVGGSWYLLKDILTELKENMSNSQIQKLMTEESLNTNVDTVTSEAIETSEKLKTAELDKLKGRLQPPEKVTGPRIHQKDTSITPISNAIPRIYSDELIGLEDSSNSAKIVEPAHASQQSKADSDSVLAACCGQEAASKPLTDFLNGLVTEENATVALGQIGSSENTLIGNEERPPNKVTTKENGSSKGIDMSSTSGGVQNVLGFVDLFQNTKMDTRAAQIDTITDEISSGYSKETLVDDPMKRKDIRSLLDRIKELPGDKLRNGYDNTTTNKDNQLNKGGLPIYRRQTAVALESLKLSKNSTYEPFTQNKLKKDVFQKFQMKEMKESESNGCTDKERTKLLKASEENSGAVVPFEVFNSQMLRDKVSGSDSCDAAINNMNSKTDGEMPLPHDKVLTKRDPNLLLYTEKGRAQTDLFLRFLRRSLNVRDIRASFVDCGPIDEVRFIFPSNNCMFKDAYVRFKTKEGLEKALSKTDVVVGGSDVILEAASPLRNMPDRLVAPNLIGDADVPAALVKNPTRTVMIKRLHHDVAFCHLKVALSSCGGDISCIFMGPSNSVAYIEFETQDAKEKALAASPISIAGKQLPILRIDVPRTTVVRISNVFVGAGINIQNICCTYGRVKKVTRRHFNIFDVHYQLEEWPNMVSILNSLNCQVVGEHKWIAQPATVIPVEILQCLWSQPDGRRHLFSKIQSLCRKFEEIPLNLAEMNGLVAKMMFK